MKAYLKYKYQPSKLYTTVKRNTQLNRRSFQGSE